MARSDRHSSRCLSACLTGAVVCISAASLTSLVASEPADRDPESAPARANDESSPSPEQIAAWIEQLSDDAYTVRQAAASDLLSAGLAARAPLLEVVDGPDPETRAAARRLIALIDKFEFSRRLEAFAADTHGKLNLSLPGWEQFHELVGGDPDARALFVEMQRQEAPLLAQVFGGRTNVGDAGWEERLLRLLQWQTTAGARRSAPPLGSCATMLFLGSVSEAGISDRSATYLAQLVQRPPVSQAMQGENQRDAVRRLVVAWVVKCPNHGELVLQQRLNTALLHKFREAVPLALGVAGSDPEFLTTQPYTRAVAILVVGQLGERDHVEHLEPLLEDSTVCIPRQARTPQAPAANVQIRDVALVVMLHLTGQNPADYGYLHIRQNPQQLFDLHSLHVADDAGRDAAIVKWRQWKKGSEPFSPERQNGPK